MFQDFFIDICYDLGDPFVNFKCTYTKDGFQTYLFVPFTTFTYYLKEKHPKEEQYITNIRKNLGGYGPKQDKIVKQAVQENFDIEKYVIAYWEYNPKRLQEFTEQQKNWIKTNEEQGYKPQKKINEFLEDFKPHNPIHTSKILDDLEQVVVNHIVNVFPELLNGEANDILKFRNILIEHIPKLGIDIINLAYKIKESKR